MRFPRFSGHGSVVEAFKSEPSTDRVWRTRSQLELAVVDYVGWVNQPAALGPRRPAARRVRSAHLVLRTERQLGIA